MYKIKNITDKLDKRHDSYNTKVSFVYTKENFTNETVNIMPKQTINVDGELPVSIHILRTKKLITVEKIESKNMVVKKDNPTKETSQQFENQTLQQKKKKFK